MALITSHVLPEYQTEIDGVSTTMPAVSYPAAYARVLFSRNFAAETRICVGWYADAAARLAGAEPVDIREFVTATPELKGDIFPAMYGYLKTLPEFTGAVDHPLADPAESVTPAPTQPEAQA